MRVDGEGNSSVPDEFWETANRARVLAATLIGMGESAALARARTQGFAVHVQERDGVAEPYRLSFDPSRINFTINDGVVTEASVH